MADTIILVRHPPVALDWQKRCYGQSDPGLSRAGQTMVAPLVDQLAAMVPDAIIHSDMKRTRAIALPLAEKLGIAPLAEPLWRERDFGDWEGQSWNAIYRETGNAMDGMIDAPDHFRPGGGETTAELVRRVRNAMDNLPCSQCIVIIAHGGPIACARAMQAKDVFQQLASYIPPAGSIVRL
jgi:alpha-ribazole phosphatase